MKFILKKKKKKKKKKFKVDAFPLKKIATLKHKNNNNKK